MSELDNRRPIPSRSSGWAQTIARVLAGWGVSANAISVSSVVFACAAGAAFLAAPFTSLWLYLVAAVCCPLRLLANLFDGMVAVEHGRGTPTGPIFNEVPDRIADVVILASAGASAGFAASYGFVADWAGPVGFVAAVGALLTAYVREMGRALGAPADFSGPFAKQQRMMAVAAGAVLAAVADPLVGHGGEVLAATVLVVAAGTLFTAWRRTARLASHLRAASTTV
ncbi:MAG: CDP-alcohol phosphatidyltransferase family protein [Pseudomonadota bacterium]